MMEHTIMHLFSFIKRKRKMVNGDYESDFDHKKWIADANSTAITISDSMMLDGSLKHMYESGLITSNSILDYFLSQRNTNTQSLYETKEEFVLRLMKHDFEKNHGISLKEFMEICRNITDNTPEKLI